MFSSAVPHESNFFSFHSPSECCWFFCKYIFHVALSTFLFSFLKKIVCFRFILSVCILGPVLYSCNDRIAMKKLNLSSYINVVYNVFVKTCLKNICMSSNMTEVVGFGSSWEHSQLWTKLSSQVKMTTRISLQCKEQLRDLHLFLLWSIFRFLIRWRASVTVLFEHCAATEQTLSKTS